MICKYFLPSYGLPLYYVAFVIWYIKFQILMQFSVSIFFKIYLFIYLWLCWVFVSVRGLSLVAASGGHSSSQCAGLSLSRPLLLQSTGSRRTGSAVVAHGPSRSAACGIFPDQGSNPCPLHWQADSQPLRHQGSPSVSIFCCLCLWCCIQEIMAKSNAMSFSPVFPFKSFIVLGL